MKTVSRREFVATAAAVGAGAMLRVPAFGANSGCHIQSREPRSRCAASESVSFEGCKDFYREHSAQRRM
jgi:hypothetical protein